MINIGRQGSYELIFLYNLLGYIAISILVHVFEQFFNLTFLAHKFLEAEAAIIVSVHPLEKFLNFLPGNNFQFRQL